MPHEVYLFPGDPGVAKRILDLYYRLEDMTHYELLGAPEHAE